MKKLVLVLLGAVLLLALAPQSGTWRWKTHWKIAEVAHKAIVEDPATPQSVKENLNWTLINAGAVAPDRWRLAPYYTDKSHLATYAKERGKYWLRQARSAWGAGAYDNASYYLGIAAHYWADLTTFAHHDNARVYFENLYGSELGYTYWDEVHDHEEGQVYYYEPVKPDCIAGYASLDNYLDNYAEPGMNSLIDNIITPGGTQVGYENGLLFYWMDGRGTVSSWEYGDLEIRVGFPRDCEASKQAVVVATHWIYNGWIRALGP